VIIKARYTTRITAAEMKYMRRTAGYAWAHHKINTEIAKKLNITQVLDKNTGLQEKLDTTCKSNAT
jgi:DNA-binding CsgD family transcriptional regulator